MLEHGPLPLQLGRRIHLEYGDRLLGYLWHPQASRIEASAEQDDLIETSLHALAYGIVDVPRAQPHSVAEEGQLEEPLRGLCRMLTGGGEEVREGVVEEALRRGSVGLFRSHDGDRERSVRDAPCALDALHVRSLRRGRLRCAVLLCANMPKGLLVGFARLLHAGAHMFLEVAWHRRLLQPRARTPLLATVAKRRSTQLRGHPSSPRARTVGGRSVRGVAGAAGRPQ